MATVERAPELTLHKTPTVKMVKGPGPLSIRMAALGGALFFILTVIMASLRSGEPAAADPSNEIFDWVAGHTSRYHLIAVLMGLAMSAALLFLSGLYRVLRRAEGAPGLSIVALGGGVLAASSTVIGALVGGVMATRINDLGAAGARVWFTMFMMSIGATLLGLLLMIAATAVVSLQKGLFPRWFGVASVILAIASIVGAFTIGYDTTAVQVTAGVTILFDSVWILLASLYLWRAPELGVMAES